MLNENMIAALDNIASKIEAVGEIDEYAHMRCDCTGGCTDGCYDCSSTSGNQW